MVSELKVVSVERVSTGSDDQEGDGLTMRGVVSPDGTTLVMQTNAQFVPEDQNGFGDIYLKDLVSRKVERVTLDPAIGDPEQGGLRPAISEDGTRIAFTTTYFFPLNNVNWAAESLFYRDLVSREMKLISASTDGEPGNDASVDPIFSPEGNRIAFNSSDDNLVDGVTPWEVLLKDIDSGVLEVLSSSAAGVPANGHSYGAGFSPDGSKFAFSSLGDNLISGDSNGVWDIFVKDLTTGEVARVSVNEDGQQGNGASTEGAFSPDGTKVLFTSRATNLVAGNGNDSQGLFIKDLLTGEIELVSTDDFGNQWIGDSFGGAFSPDGTKITFYTDSHSLTVRDDNNATDVFVKDLLTGAVTAVSRNADGQIGNAQSLSPQFLPDGSGVLFTSLASNLVPDDTNGTWDLFVARLEEQELGEIVQWSEAEGGNGHWYQYVETSLTWSEARADAEARSHLGLAGYLATITSADENAFILSMTPPNVWVGGTDERDEGVWEWAGGPEVGEVFWTRQDGTVTYADWGGYEPNNAWREPPGEDYLLAHALYATGTWADAGIPPNPNGAFGYVVEYSDVTPLPAGIGPGRTEAESLDIESGFFAKSNPWASGDSFLQASGGGEAVVSGAFTGEAGLYSVIIGYFDEADGASTMRFAVNGEVISDWDWDADPAGDIVTGAAARKQVVSFVELEAGDRLTLAGTADGGEPLRTDYIDIRPAPPASGLFRVEAETLEITDDFQIVGNPHASGDAYLQAGGGPNQRAVYDFDGLGGRYDLTIGYFDESDGVSEMSVLLNGIEVDSWLWDGAFGDRIVTPAGAAQHTLFGLELLPGDRIELYGHPDGGEPLRTDYLIFDPVEEVAGADALLFA